MKSLAVAEVFPWPADDGYRLRVSNLIEAFAEQGPVDFVCLDGSARPRGEVPANVRVIDAPERPELPMAKWLGPWLRGGLTDGLPRRLLRRDYATASRVIATLNHDDYDVCFVSHVDSFRPVAASLVAPTLLDFDNLEDGLTRTIRLAGPAIEPGSGRVGIAKAWVRWLVASAFNLVDERRWERVQRDVAAQVDRTFVCSQLDVERSAIPNVVAVPNGYERTFEPADHRTVTNPTAPVFLFIGLLSYEPNSDAVRWFGGEVLPLIRAQIPDAVFRVVGRGSEHVAAVGQLPGVDLVGGVESLEPYLAAADVAVIPLRSGAGTRLKVVEAMANRLPMVTTSIGCEGIDVVDGEHAWIRDDVAAFAAACVDAVTDLDRRAATIEAAEQRYLERYRWSSIRAEVGRLAREVAERRSSRAR